MLFHESGIVATFKLLALLNVPLLNLTAAVNVARALHSYAAHPVSSFFEHEARDKFRSRPALFEWDRRLRALLERGNTSPCEADIILPFKECGFGSNVNAIMEALWAAVYGNFTVAFDWRTPEFLNSLVPGFSVPVCTGPEAKKRSAVSMPSLVSPGFMRSLKDLYAGYILDTERFLYSQLFHSYKPQVAKHVNARLKAIGLRKSVSYIGVHIRHGDKYTETVPVPTERYGKAVTKNGMISRLSDVEIELTLPILLNAIRSQKERLVYLATDDAEAAQLLQESLGDGFEVRYAGESDQESHNYKDDRTMVGLLTDIEALRRSSVFLGTGTSNLGRLIYLLRRDTERSISLDTQGFPVWDHVRG